MYRHESWGSGQVVKLGYELGSFIRHCGINKGGGQGGGLGLCWFRSVQGGSGWFRVVGGSMAREERP